MTTSTPRTINELISDVQAGTRTATEAAQLALPYAVHYYRPRTSEDWDTWLAIGKAFEELHPPKPSRQPAPPVHRFTCSHCGEHRDTTIAGECDDCGERGEQS